MLLNPYRFPASGGATMPPALGDAWPEQGGFYAGEYTVGGATFYLVDGGYAAEASGLLWKHENTATAGTASTDDGLANCGYIVASNLTIHPAARHCMSWNGGGFNDWYLGSVNELAFIRSRLWYDLPGVNANYGPAGAQRFGQSILQYWSSTTSAATSAVLYHFGVNVDAPADKTNALVCRPIRRVLKV